jgi:thiol-disulfide isomerase/thioredoxin
MAWGSAYPDEMRTTIAVRWVTVELGLVALGVALLAGVVLSVLKHRYDGRFRREHAVPEVPDFGQPLGERATLVQFSSAFCAPCRATHRVLADVARMVDGVRHIEIDAESNLDLVRRLDVMRTPTVLVLDADGRLVTRASGQPRTVDVIAAVGKAVDGGTRQSA